MFRSGLLYSCVELNFVDKLRVSRFMQEQRSPQCDCEHSVDLKVLCCERKSASVAL